MPTPSTITPTPTSNIPPSLQALLNDQKAAEEREALRTAETAKTAPAASVVSAPKEQTPRSVVPTVDQATRAITGKKPVGPAPSQGNKIVGHIADTYAQTGQRAPQSVPQAKQQALDIVKTSPLNKNKKVKTVIAPAVPGSSEAEYEAAVNRRGDERTQAQVNEESNKQVASDIIQTARDDSSKLPPQTLAGLEPALVKAEGMSEEEARINREKEAQSREFHRILAVNNHATKDAIADNIRTTTPTAAPATIDLDTLNVPGLVDSYRKLQYSNTNQDEVPLSFYEHVARDWAKKGIPADVANGLLAREGVDITAVAEAGQLGGRHSIHNEEKAQADFNTWMHRERIPLTNAIKAQKEAESKKTVASLNQLAAEPYVPGKTEGKFDIKPLGVINGDDLGTFTANNTDSTPEVHSPAAQYQADKLFTYLTVRSGGNDPRGYFEQYASSGDWRTAVNNGAKQLMADAARQGHPITERQALDDSLRVIAAMQTKGQWNGVVRITDEDAPIYSSFKSRLLPETVIVGLSGRQGSNAGHLVTRQESAANWFFNGALQVPESAVQGIKKAAVKGHIEASQEFPVEGDTNKSANRFDRQDETDKPKVSWEEYKARRDAGLPPIETNQNAQQQYKRDVRALNLLAEKLSPEVADAVEKRAYGVGTNLEIGQMYNASGTNLGILGTLGMVESVLTPSPVEIASAGMQAKKGLTTLTKNTDVYKAWAPYAKYVGDALNESPAMKALRYDVKNGIINTNYIRAKRVIPGTDLPLDLANAHTVEKIALLGDDAQRQAQASGLLTHTTNAAVPGTTIELEKPINEALEAKEKLEAATRIDLPETVKHQDRLGSEIAQIVRETEAGSLSPQARKAARALDDEEMGEALGRMGRQADEKLPDNKFGARIENANVDAAYMKKAKGVGAEDYAKLYGVRDQLNAALHLRNGRVLNAAGTQEALVTAATKNDAVKAVADILGVNQTVKAKGVTTVSKMPIKDPVIAAFKQQLAADIVDGKLTIEQAKAKINAFSKAQRKAINPALTGKAKVVASNAKALEVRQAVNGLSGAFKEARIQSFMMNPTETLDTAQRALWLRAEIRNTAGKVLSKNMKEFRIQGGLGNRESTAALTTLSKGGSIGNATERSHNLWGTIKEAREAKAIKGAPLSVDGLAFANRLVEVFSRSDNPMSKIQARYYAEMMDARARAWSTANGRPASAYYTERFGEHLGDEKLGLEYSSTSPAGVPNAKGATHTLGGDDAVVMAAGQNRRIIEFFKSADFSTAAHEFAHVFRADMGPEAIALHAAEMRALGVGVEIGKGDAGLELIDMDPIVFKQMQAIYNKYPTATSTTWTEWVGAIDLVDDELMEMRKVAQTWSGTPEELTAFRSEIKAKFRERELLKQKEFDAGMTASRVMAIREKLPVNASTGSKVRLRLAEEELVRESAERMANDAAELSSLTDANKGVELPAVVKAEEVGTAVVPAPSPSPEVGAVVGSGKVEPEIKVTDDFGDEERAFAQMEADIATEKARRAPIVIDEKKPMVVPTVEKVKAARKAKTSTPTEYQPPGDKQVTTAVNATLKQLDGYKDLAETGSKEDIADIKALLNAYIRAKLGQEPGDAMEAAQDFFNKYPTDFVGLSREAFITQIEMDLKAGYGLEAPSNVLGSAVAKNGSRKTLYQTDDDTEKLRDIILKKFAPDMDGNRQTVLNRFRVLVDQYLSTEGTKVIDGQHIVYQDDLLEYLAAHGVTKEEEEAFGVVGHVATYIDPTTHEAYYKYNDVAGMLDRRLGSRGATYDVAHPDKLRNRPNGRRGQTDRVYGGSVFPSYRRITNPSYTNPAVVEAAPIWFDYSPVGDAAKHEVRLSTGSRSSLMADYPERKQLGFGSALPKTGVIPARGFRKTEEELSTAQRAYTEYRARHGNEQQVDAHHREQLEYLKAQAEEQIKHPELPLNTRFITEPDSNNFSGDVRQIGSDEEPIWRVSIKHTPTGTELPYTDVPGARPNVDNIINRFYETDADTDGNLILYRVPGLTVEQQVRLAAIDSLVQAAATSADRYGTYGVHFPDEDYAGIFKKTLEEFGAKVEEVNIPDVLINEPVWEGSKIVAPRHKFGVRGVVVTVPDKIMEIAQERSPYLFQDAINSDNLTPAVKAEEAFAQQFEQHLLSSNQDEINPVLRGADEWMKQVYRSGQVSPTTANETSPIMREVMDSLFEEKRGFEKQQAFNINAEAEPLNLRLPKRAESEAPVELTPDQRIYQRMLTRPEYQQTMVEFITKIGDDENASFRNLPPATRHLVMYGVRGTQEVMGNTARLAIEAVERVGADNITKPIDGKTAPLIDYLDGATNIRYGNGMVVPTSGFATAPVIQAELNKVWNSLTNQDRAVLTRVAKMKIDTGSTVLYEADKEYLLNLALGKAFKDPTMMPNSQKRIGLFKPAIIAAAANGIHGAEFREATKITPNLMGWLAKIYVDNANGADTAALIDNFAAPVGNASRLEGGEKVTAAVLVATHGGAQWAAKTWSANQLGLKSSDVDLLQDWLHGRDIKLTRAEIKASRVEAIAQGLPKDTLLKDALEAKRQRAPKLAEKFGLDANDGKGFAKMDELGLQQYHTTYWPAMARKKLADIMTQAERPLTPEMMRGVGYGKTPEQVRKEGGKLAYYMVATLQAINTSGRYLARAAYFAALGWGDASQGYVGAFGNFRLASANFLRIIPQLAITNTPLLSTAGSVIQSAEQAGRAAYNVVNDVRQAGKARKEAVMPRTYEKIRRGLQTMGDKTAQAVSGSRFNPEVNKILDRSEETVPGTNFTYAMMADKMIETGVHADFDSSELERALFTVTTDDRNKLKRLGQAFSIADRDMRRAQRDLAENLALRSRLGTAATLIAHKAEEAAAAGKGPLTIDSAIEAGDITAKVLYDYANTVSGWDRHIVTKMFNPYQAWRKNNARAVLDNLQRPETIRRMARLYRFERNGGRLLSEAMYYLQVDNYGVNVDELNDEQKDLYYRMTHDAEFGMGAVETWTFDQKENVLRSANKDLAPEKRYKTFEEAWANLEEKERNVLVAGYGGPENVPYEVRMGYRQMFGGKYHLTEENEARTLGKVTDSQGADILGSAEGTPGEMKPYSSAVLDKPNRNDVSDYTQSRAVVGFTPHQVTVGDIPYIVMPECYILDPFTNYAALAEIGMMGVWTGQNLLMDDDNPRKPLGRPGWDNVISSAKRVVDPGRATLIGGMLEYLEDDGKQVELPYFMGKGLDEQQNFPSWLIRKKQGEVNAETGEMLSPDRYFLLPGYSYLFENILATVPLVGIAPEAWREYRRVDPTDRTAAEYAAPKGSALSIVPELVRQTGAAGVVTASEKKAVGESDIEVETESNDPKKLRIER